MYCSAGRTGNDTDHAGIFGQRLLVIRIKQARRLLEDTDLSVSQIATQIGFNNITYFDRVFREIVLISPRTYRTAVKKKPATEIS